ncbi:MAG: hypothetical protein L0099_06395 [Acidobacteria bacterium]|nr:hypothetical protein [Acidobacteriota bacterium]
MTRKLALVLAFALVASLFAVAGDASTANVPKLIRIAHHEVKPGKMAAYDNLVRQVRQAATAGNANYNWIAARPITGNSNENVFVNFYDSFAQIEEASARFYKAADATFKSAEFTTAITDSQASVHGIVAKLREDLSYRPAKLDIANARTWEVTIVRLKPGMEMDFTELEKEVIELHKRGNIDEHWVAYEVAYGTQAPAIIYIRGLRTLADLDADLKDAHNAVFTPAIRRRFSETAKEAVVYEKSTLLNVRPEISRPSEALVAANPDFWTVKEEPTAVAGKGKKAKTAGMQPAAMKSDEKPKN